MKDDLAEILFQSFPREGHHEQFLHEHGCPLFDSVHSFSLSSLSGNSWRCEGVGALRRCCDGCGPQEQFYACADVDVRSSSGAAGNHSPVGSTFLQNANSVGHGAQVMNPTPYNKPPSIQYYVQSTLPPSQQYGHPNQFYQYARPNGQYVPKPQTPPPSNYHVFLGNSQQVSVYSYYSRCRGIPEPLTDYCRRNCRSGFCSRVYCNEACQWLRSYYDQPEEDETHDAQQK